MKAHRPVIVVLSILGVAAAAFWHLQLPVSALVPGEALVLPGADDARSSTSYVIDREGWLSFRIPLGQQALKLVTNANVHESYFGKPDFACAYTLHYQLVDAAGNVLRDQVYGLNAAFLLYLSDVTGRPVPAQHYRGVPLVPLGPRAIMVNLEGFADQSARFRLRIADADPPVSDVAVRLYFNEKPPPYKLRYLWQRLPEPRKERLARANVYTVDLLSEDEKRNLLENRWAAMAPSGIQGKDYSERKLFTIVDDDASRLVDSILPPGLYVDASLRGVIPIPEGGGCLRLELELCDPFPAGGGSVLVTWFGEHPEERSDTEVEIEGLITTYVRDYRGGYLEISAGERLAVRAAVLAMPQEMDITPDPGCLPAYRLRRGQGLDFSISNRNPGHVPVRIDLRQFWAQTPALALDEAAIHYQLLDASGDAIESGVILHAERLSAYDRVVGGSSGWLLTDPSRHYFWFPRECASIRFDADRENVLVTVYTRPDALPRHLRVPEDYLAYEKGDSGLRNWFLVRPQQYAECLREHGEALLKVQERPPLYSEDFLARNFQNVVVEPLGAATGHKLLTPARDPAERRDAFSPARFVALPRAEPSLCYFGANAGGAAISPRVIHLKETEEPSALKLFIDGRPHLELTVGSRSSEIEIPRLAPGWHEVTVASLEPSQTYINAVQNAGLALHVERIVYATGRGGLLYSVEKESAAAETLVFRAFRPHDARARTRLRVQLRGQSSGEDQGPRIERNPLDSWTYWNNVYDLREPTGEAWPILSADEPPLAGGEVFLLTLGADLSPGAYEIAVTQEDGPPCFLMLVKLTPGRSDPRRTFVDRGADLGDLSDG